MRLYVDDLRNPPDDSWTLARTNTEAIRFLATGHVTEVSIDHDICVPNVEFIDQAVRKRLAIGEETFQPVAYYLAAMPEILRPTIISLHTANPIGAESMMFILKRAGIAVTYKQGSYKIELGEL